MIAPDSFLMPKIIAKFKWDHPYGGDKWKWGWLKLATFDGKCAKTRKRYKIDALEVDRISVLVSVSAPKLVKSLVSVWFRFRYVKPRQVSVSAENVSEFRC